MIEDRKLRMLKKLCIKLGRKPTHKEINNCSYTPSKGYYNWKYGCMENAFKKIGCENLNTKEGMKKSNIISSFFRLKKELGFVPSSNDWKKYSSIDISVIYRLFGSWSGFLKELGEKPNRKTPTSFRNKKRIFIAKDGHVCYSKKECEIDNLLYDLGLEHDNEVFYPYDEKFNKNKRKRCDWKVGDTYLEYAGMLSYYNKKTKYAYKKRIEEKMNLCLFRGLNFAYIEPNSLNVIQTDLENWFK